MHQNSEFSEEEARSDKHWKGVCSNTTTNNGVSEQYFSFPLSKSIPAGINADQLTIKIDTCCSYSLTSDIGLLSNIRKSSGSYSGHKSGANIEVEAVGDMLTYFIDIKM